MKTLLLTMTILLSVKIHAEPEQSNHLIEYDWIKLDKNLNQTRKHSGILFDDRQIEVLSVWEEKRFGLKVFWHAVFPQPRKDQLMGDSYFQSILIYTYTDVKPRDISQLPKEGLVQKLKVEIKNGKESKTQVVLLKPEFFINSPRISLFNLSAQW
jgi:hypothetical protein